jgi:hypothetical protein
MGVTFPPLCKCGPIQINGTSHIFFQIPLRVLTHVITPYTSFPSRSTGNRDHSANLTLLYAPSNYPPSSPRQRGETGSPSIARLPTFQNQPSYDWESLTVAALRPVKQSLAYVMYPTFENAGCPSFCRRRNLIQINPNHSKMEARHAKQSDKQHMRAARVLVEAIFNSIPFKSFQNGGETCQVV